jgi:hypothetical protein
VDEQQRKSIGRSEPSHAQFEAIKMNPVYARHTRPNSLVYRCSHHPAHDTP